MALAEEDVQDVVAEGGRVFWVEGDPSVTSAEGQLVTKDDAGVWSVTTSVSHTPKLPNARSMYATASSSPSQSSTIESGWVDV